MFDRKKIINQINELQKFSSQHNLLYVAGIVNIGLPFAILNKLKINLKGILSLNNTTPPLRFPI